MVSVFGADFWYVCHWHNNICMLLMIYVTSASRGGKDGRIINFAGITAVNEFGVVTGKDRQR